MQLVKNECGTVSHSLLQRPISGVGECNWSCSDVGTTSPGAAEAGLRCRGVQPGRLGNLRGIPAGFRGRSPARTGLETWSDSDQVAEADQRCRRVQRPNMLEPSCRALVAVADLRCRGVQPQVRKPVRSPHRLQRRSPSEGGATQQFVTRSPTWRSGCRRRSPSEGSATETENVRPVAHFPLQRPVSGVGE